MLKEFIEQLSEEKQQEIEKLEFLSITDPRMKDKTGMWSGKIYILGRAPAPQGSKKSTYWWGICTECQNIVRLRTDAVGKTQRCQQCGRKQAGQTIKQTGVGIKDLTNQTFGKLTALYLLDKRDNQGHAIWHCKCQCGNEIDVPGISLTSGNTKSCGCLRKENTYFAKTMKKDLTGQRFGKLTVLEETDQRYFSKIVWKCKCDCGKITYLPTTSLTQGNTRSCGCITKSQGANNVEKCLFDNNIPFIKEYNISELGNKKFDFAILNQDKSISRFIEYDGEQHFRATGGWNNKEAYELITKRDQEKNQWCKDNNIPLVRIPYWERDHITLNMILGDQYLIK